MESLISHHAQPSPATSSSLMTVPLMMLVVVLELPVVDGAARVGCIAIQLRTMRGALAGNAFGTAHTNINSPRPS